MTIRILGTSALAWLAIMSLILRWNLAPMADFGAALSLWFVALLDLGALGGLISAVLGFLGAGTDSGFRSVFAVRALFWATIKLVMLGTLIALLWRFSQQALLAVALGAGTLVFVPLVGGWVWSFSAER